MLQKTTLHGLKEGVCLKLSLIREEPSLMRY
jgi:hypothetical protein